MTETDPIMNVEWVPASSLRANEWNPNFVMTPELTLLEASIRKQGWIQPILVSRDGEIIDGFHRWSLSMSSKTLRARYDGRVPVVRLDIDEPDAMMLTVRINRAKGAHSATRMSDLVRRLVDVHGCDRQEIAAGIGATDDEIDLLYERSIWKSKDLENWEFSRAWIPKEDGKGGRRKSAKKKRKKPILTK